MTANIIMAILFVLAYVGLYMVFDLIDAGSQLRAVKKDVEKKTEKARLILVVKDAEDTIEERVRKFRKLAKSTLYEFEEAIIIDMGSSDNTLEIINKLTRKDDEITVLTILEKDYLCADFDR